MADMKTFIERWAVSGGSERANSRLFLVELMDAQDAPPDYRTNFFSIKI